MADLETLGNQILGNDLVVNEDSCNLGCKYCLTGQSNLKKSHQDQLIFQPPTVDVYKPESELGKRLHKIVDRAREGLGTPLLKVTGGEIFIVKGMIDFIERCAPYHEVIVVQTNALPLTPERLKRLSALGKVVLQISLDASTYEGNSYRVGAESLHDKLIAKIEAAIESGIPVEIYGVLNDRSVEHLPEFVAWCDSFAENRPVLFPFPVRGPDSLLFQVREDQYPLVDELLELKSLYPEVLPPVPYVERVIRFYRRNGRSWRCHLPRLVVSTFSDGVTTACPNIWFNDMGDLTQEDWRQVIGKVNTTPFYELLLGERPRIDACKGCLTPWDTLSLYFEDEIDLDELCKAPTYSPPKIRALLEAKKAAYKESLCVA